MVANLPEREVGGGGHKETRHYGLRIEDIGVTEPQKEP